MRAPDEQIQGWAIQARKKDFHYILSIFIEGTGFYPIYCPTFNDMHDLYHINVDKDPEIIRVDHDGSVERHLAIKNLL